MVEAWLICLFEGLIGEANAILSIRFAVSIVSAVVSAITSAIVVFFLCFSVSSIKVFLGDEDRFEACIFISDSWFSW